MGGKVWSYEEEFIFWTKIIPSSCKRAGLDRLVEEHTWDHLSSLMQTLMGNDARRCYTPLCLFEHFFQNAVNKRPSPNAHKFVWRYLNEAQENASAAALMHARPPPHEKRRTLRITKSKNSNNIGGIISSGNNGNKSPTKSGRQIGRATVHVPVRTRPYSRPTREPSSGDSSMSASPVFSNTPGSSAPTPADRPVRDSSICSLAFILNKEVATVTKSSPPADDGEGDTLFVVPSKHR